jgi:hypothetical protein
MSTRCLQQSQVVEERDVFSRSVSLDSLFCPYRMNETRDHAHTLLRYTLIAGRGSYLDLPVRRQEVDSGKRASFHLLLFDRSLSSRGSWLS